MDKLRPIPSSQITAESTYFNRRTFMRAGILAAPRLVQERLSRVEIIPVRWISKHRLDQLSAARQTHG